MEADRKFGKVLCYGVLRIDQIIRASSAPERDGTLRILSEGEYIGGRGANTAVTLSCLGIPVKLMGSTLGDDRRGGLFLRAIRRYRVDASDLDLEQGVRTAHAVLLSDQDGERSPLAYIPDLRSRPLRAEDLEGVSLFFVDASLGRNAVEAARLAREKGLAVFAFELSEGHPLSEFCDVVVNSSGFVRQHREDRASDIAVGLLKAGVETVVITRGHEGCSVYRENGSSFDQPAFSVSVRDTTGAGDAFCAGLIYGYLQGWTLTRSVLFAGGTAALNCCGPGGSGHISGEEQVMRLIGSA